MSLTRRRLLAGGSLLLAGAGVSIGLASKPSIRGTLDRAAQRAEVSITRRITPGPPPPPTAVRISVDSTRVIRPISPLIYGTAHANPDQLVDLGVNLNRWGGNPNTRYNWVTSAWNAARDWEFRNYGDDSSKSQSAGSAADGFVSANQSVGVESVFTVPAMGWVAQNRDKQVQSVGVPADGGAPLSTGSDAIAGYDPSSNRQHTSIPSFARKNAPFTNLPDANPASVFQDEFVHHLVNRFGSAAEGGVRYYVVDNEPDLWSSTHTDVHPAQMSYDQMLGTFVDYALAIKSVDPHASVAGPALSGWSSYFFSARDRGSDTYRTHADRQAHGDMPFLPWWLEQVRKHDEQAGARSLDVLDVHYYPQANGVFGAADDPYTRGLRVRSTRSLWDSSYIDESWIADRVRLIPRMREWIDQYYPGTKLAIGEWNWGGEKSTSGALAIADVLGIFGREGVDLASYWTFPPLDSPAAQAFRLYTRYNDRGDAFGDQSLATTLDTSADYVTAYASLDSSSGDLVVIAINKLETDVAADVVLGRSGTLESYTLADAAIRPDLPQQIDPTTPTRVTLTGQSIRLLRLRQA